MRRLPRWWVWGAVLCAGASPACSREGAVPSVAARDSAGVTITESSGPSWTLETEWAVEPTPLLDLGRSGSGPMHEFYQVSGATFGADSSIAVADRGSSQVRVYDAAGRFATAFGAEGDGPGEFRRLGGVARYAGDSLVAFDPSARRATIIGASRSLGRVATLDIPEHTVAHELSPLLVSRSAGFLVAVTVLPSGRPPSGRPPSGLVAFPQLVLETSATGALLDTVAALRGFEQYLGPTGIETPPLARFSHAAEHRGELYACDGVSPEYAIFAHDGAKRSVVRVPGMPLDVPRDVLDSIRASLETGRENLEAMASAVPTTYPSCSSILVDALGYVWLERYHAPFVQSAEPRVWLIFSPDGGWLGKLAFPAGFEVLEVDVSRILGVARDTLGVESVQVLGLRRRQPRRRLSAPRPP